MSETLCTTSVAWLEDICLCFQMQKSTSLSHDLITCCLFPIEIFFFKHVFFPMTSQLGEAGIFQGDHLTLLQVSPGYLGCGSKLVVVPQRRPGQSELDLYGSPVDVHCLKDRDL